MSNGQILVTFGALEAASQNISSAISTLNSKLSDLEAAAAPMIQAWESEAQQAYSQRQQAWRRAAQDMTELLGRIKSALDQSAQQYQATERTNTNLFS